MDNSSSDLFHSISPHLTLQKYTIFHQNYYLPVTTVPRVTPSLTQTENIAIAIVKSDSSRMLSGCVSLVIPIVTNVIKKQRIVRLAWLLGCSVTVSFVLVPKTCSKLS